MEGQNNLQPSSNRKEDKGFFDGNPKMIFVFGLMTGIAIFAIFGGGVNLPELNANNGGSKVVGQVDPTGGNAAAPSAGVLAPITEDDHIRGDINKAKVVMVEYSDFECPFCGRHHPSMLSAMDDFGDDVAWVYRHFPLSFHPEAVPSALASECAGEQGKFWEFADVMFENQTGLNDDLYMDTAKDLKLKMSQFEDCYESAKYQDKVDSDMAGGSTAGVSGTPATFINGQLVSGAVPYATLKDAISSFLE